MEIERLCIFDGRFIEAIGKECKELIPHFEGILKRIEDAKYRAREDVWMLGILKDLEEDIHNLRDAIRIYCSLVEALKLRVE